MLSDREKKLLKEFGLEPLDKRLFRIPHKFISRDIFIAVRGKDEFKRMMEGEPFYILTGIMPSYKLIHLGTYAVVESIKYFQRFSKVTILAIADIESLSTRNISLDKAKEYALNYHIPTYLALGLDEKNTLFYFQSDNSDILKVAGDVSRKTTFSEMKAIYGDISPGRVLSSLIQIGDILFPQFSLDMMGLVPIGLDQDPHMRLCRDYIRRTNFFKFKQVASIYLRLIPGLDGSEKMSKSDPENSIFLPEEDYESLKRKIWRAYSGGRPTVEEHRKYGANLEIDVPYKLLTYILEDDKEWRRIGEAYAKGELLSGEIKTLVYQSLVDFMEAFKENLNYYRDLVNSGRINFIKTAEDIKSYI